MAAGTGPAASIDAVESLPGTAVWFLSWPAAVKASVALTAAGAGPGAAAGTPAGRAGAGAEPFCPGAGAEPFCPSLSEAGVVLLAVAMTELGASAGGATAGLLRMLLGAGLVTIGGHLVGMTADNGPSP